MAVPPEVEFNVTLNVLLNLYVVELDPVGFKFATVEFCNGKINVLSSSFA